MKAPKFITNMRLTGVVHMREPAFHAKVMKVAEFHYMLIDITRWPLDKHFPEDEPKFLKAIVDAEDFLSKKARERKNNPDWLYPV